MESTVFADGRPRHCVRIAAYSILWLGLCLLGAIGGSMLWLVIAVMSVVCVGWLSSVPMRSSVTLADDAVMVCNGRRTRCFARAAVRTVSVKDNYAHLRVTGVRRQVRCWALPCPDGVMSASALTLQHAIDDPTAVAV